MLKYSPILLVLLGFASSAKVICYYTSWAVNQDQPAYVEPEDLDPSLCTHINYAFVALNDDGTLKAARPDIDITKDLYNRVTNLKQINPDLKVLLSVGGASAPVPVFQSVAADPNKRAAMVQSARSFMEQYRFDGIDMDWEVPEPSDRENFIALLRDIRADFDKNGWELTAAVHRFPSEGYDVPQMNEILDYINIMSYDMYGPWINYTGQNAPLYASSLDDDLERSTRNVDASIRNWRNKGASDEKMVLGLAFYGRTYTLKDPNQNGLHAPYSSPGKPGPYVGESGVMTYLEFCGTNWDCRWDDEQKNPICVNGDQWLGVDNVDSIKVKVDYINQNNLAGAMIWSIDQDDVHGTHRKEKILLHTVVDNLK